MGRPLPLAVLVIFLGLPFAIAQLDAPSTRPQTEQEWNQLWSQLAKSDSQAGNLKNGDGTWIGPAKAVLTLLGELTPVIRKTAALFDVDPRAIVGSILAENSMNVGVTDEIQDVLVSWKIAPTGSLFGKKFTFGLGQIGLDAARSAEQTAALWEGRAVRSDQQIANELMSPAGAVYYAAAILRQAQNVYKEKGFDIANRPEILATIYNLGAPELLAEKAKKANRQPKMNYFGLFVYHYLPDIEAAIRYNPKDPYGLEEVKSRGGSEAERIFVSYEAKHTLPLRSSPTVCETDDQHGNRERYHEIDSRTEFPVVAKIDAGEIFEVLSPGVGCGLQEWSLIRASNGVVGWLTTDVLNRLTEKRFSVNKPCFVSQQTECLGGLSGIFQQDALEVSSEEGVFVRLSGGEVVNWKYAGALYERPNGVLTAPSASSNAEGEAFLRLRDEVVKKREQTLSDLKVYLKTLGNITAPEIESLTWDSSYNPYNTILRLDPFDQVQRFLAEGYNVHLNPQVSRYAAALAKPLVVPPKDLDQLVSTLAALSNVSVSFTRRTDLSDEEKEAQRKLNRAYYLKLKEKLTPCIPCFEKFEKTKKIWQSVEKNFEEGAIRKQDVEDSPALSTLRSLCAYIDPKIEAQLRLIDGFSPSPYCSLDVLADAKSNSHVSVPLSVLRPMLTSEDLQRDILEKALTACFVPFTYSSAYSALAEERAKLYQSTYDPFKTAELIGDLLENPCVQHVFVPDPWLAKAFSGNPNVVYRPFLETDRMLVDVGKPCGGHK